jgi:hypothetical protein
MGSGCEQVDESVDGSAGASVSIRDTTRPPWADPLLVNETTHVRVGDLIAYPGTPSKGGRLESDYLRVTRVADNQLWGRREHPMEWEKEYEYTVVAPQLRERGVLIIDSYELGIHTTQDDRPTRSEHSLEGAAVNGLTPVGQEDEP